MTRLEQDIRNQPASLARCLQHQFGPGSEALERAAAALTQARRVVLTGMGASLHSLVPLTYLLRSHGVDAHHLETAELLHYGFEICRDAVVVFVSRSGDTIEITRLLPKIAAMAQHVVGVTNEPSGFLARNAGTVLLLNANPDELIAIQTYTCTVLTLLLTGLRAAGRSLAELRDEAGILAPAATETLEQVRPPRPDLSLASFHYIMARGPSLGTARGGCLLLHETAKFPSTAFSIGDFRHGAIEAVDAQFHSTVVATQSATEALDRAFIDSLIAFGAHVTPITRAQFPAVPEVFLPVIEIIPLQFAALHLALQRNLVPGKFRYAGAVTDSETAFALPHGG